MKKIFSLLFLLVTCIAQAQNVYRTDKDISYVSGSETDTYRQERCKLDIYYPLIPQHFDLTLFISS